jgi:hypothetical protein
MTIRGWIYVITNRAMPGLVKIGYSTKDPALRAVELGNTGAPHAYEVAYDALVDSPKAVEASLHCLFAAQREGREWFRLTPQSVVEAVHANVSRIYLEKTNAAFKPQPLEAVGASCDYTPDCKAVPTRKYHQMTFCEDHYTIYMAARAKARRRVGPGTRTR